MCLFFCITSFTGENSNANLLLPLLFLLSALVSLGLRLFTSSSSFRRVDSMLELWYLLSKVDHNGFTCRELFFQKFTICLLQLHFESPSKHWLLASLSGVELPF